MRRSRREEEDRRVISISLHAAEGLLDLGMDRNRHPEMGKACVCVWGGVSGGWDQGGSGFVGG